MNAHVITPEITTLIERCERVNSILWRYGTQENREEMELDFEPAIERFRRAATVVMRQQETIEPAGIETMLRYIEKNDASELLTKFDAVAILFQAMRLQLRSAFVDDAHNQRVKPSIQFVREVESYASTSFTRRDLDQLVSIGHTVNDPRLSEESVMECCRSRRGTIILGMNRVREEIASYVFCNLTGTGVDILGIEAAPKFTDTDARTRLLEGFDWWIPHQILQGCQRFVTTAPIDLAKKSETDFFAAHDFVAFGGVRDARRELTHVRMGKLTKEFESFGDL